MTVFLLGMFFESINPVSTSLNQFIRYQINFHYMPNTAHLHP